MLIVDGHPAHRARIIRDFVAANPELIELHFPPGYAPEPNPAEMLNQDVKANALGRRRPLDVTALKADVRTYLRARQRRPSGRSPSTSLSATSPTPPRLRFDTPG